MTFAHSLNPPWTFGSFHSCASPAPRSDSQTTAAQPDVNPASASTTSLAVAQSVGVDGEEEEFGYSDLKKNACLLCQRQLKSVDLLRKHNAASDLHKVYISLHSLLVAKCRRISLLPSERADVRNRSSFSRRRLPCALGSLIHLTLLFDLLLSPSVISKTLPSARSPKNALQQPEQLPRPSTATARSTAESRSTNRPLPLPTRLARPTRQGSSASLSKDRRRTLDCLRRNLCWRRGRIQPTSAIGCWPRWAGTKGKGWVCREKGGSSRFRRKRLLRELDWELRSPRRSVRQVGREARGGRTLGRPRSRCVLPLPLSSSLLPLLPLAPRILFQSLLLPDTLFDLRS